MNFEEKLKKLRKKAGFSQEKLAEKLGVSRQAVTKWETENGIPDIENIISISKLFDISIDELLLDKEIKKEDLEYLFESVTEYDIDDVKHFDLDLGDGKSVVVKGYNGEKLFVTLFSNTLVSIEETLKVKIDDIKKRVDVEIKNCGAITKSQIKEELSILIQVPNRYTKSIEIGAHAKDLELNDLQAEKTELNVKANNLYFKNVAGDVEIDCNMDIQIIWNSLQGELSINQCSAVSKLFIPEKLSFKAIKKGIGTKIYYEKEGDKIGDFSQRDSDNVVEFNGIKSELIISPLVNEEG